MSPGALSRIPGPFGPTQTSCVAPTYRQQEPALVILVAFQMSFAIRTLMLYAPPYEPRFDSKNSRRPDASLRVSSPLSINEKVVDISPISRARLRVVA